MQSFTPTQEQLDAADLFQSGENLALVATAGSGKTRTIQYLAESNPRRRGIVTAFNRAIIDEAASKMPSSVQCSTMHSLAYRSVGHRYKHRLNSPRMKSTEIARRLRIDPLVVKSEIGGRKVLAAGYLAGLVMRSVDLFCQSADDEPGEQHVPYVEGIDEPYPDGARTYGNNRGVRSHIAPAMRRAWADLSSPDGVLKFSHGHYLKTFALGHPQLSCDFLCTDEFQDMSGLMLGLIRDQQCQIVGVGDPQQMINEWMGARDGFDEIDFAYRSYLTKSFRFGPAIADVANGLLDRLGAECRVVGGAPWTSTVAPVDEPDLILTRTNAKAVELVLEMEREGRTAYLMGGGADVVAFAKAAKSLMAGEWTSHFELACFDNWGDVQLYVDSDEQGGDLRLLVNLIDRYGADTIIASLSNATPEHEADVTVSTCHRMKGREANRVQVAGDFIPPRNGASDLSPCELRLAYVAATRARHELDLTAVPHFLAAPLRLPESPPVVLLPS